MTLADTEANQAKYPQPASQRQGLGFPRLRAVALLCLSSGAVLAAATGPCKGKGGDEQTLLRGLLDHLAPDDVVLGDAFFPTYFLLCELQRRGVDGLFEQYGARKRRTDFRRGKRLGPRDHLIVWDKPKQPDWMAQADYDQVPQTLTVREFRAANKIMVTTFLCPKQTPKRVLKALYKQRWNVEIDQSWCLRKEIIQWRRRRRRCRRVGVAPNGAVLGAAPAGAQVRRSRPKSAIGDARRARLGGPAAGLCAAS
jgi:hypothetical protein